MAVTDLWHKRGGGLCEVCGQDAGPASARHGRGLRWRVTVPGWPSESFAQKGQAERREVALWNLPKPTARGETVGDIVQVWLDGKAGLTATGLHSARYGAQVVLGRWGQVALRDMDGDEVRAWIGGLSTPQGPASLSMRTKALQCLKGSLDVAVRRGLLAANPAQGVTVPQQTVREGRALTLDEVQRLAQAMRERWGRFRGSAAGVPPYEAMVWLMVTAGPRISEVCSVTVSGVDAERRRVRVLGKGRKWRNLPVAAEVLDLLDLDRPGGAPLFPARGGGFLDARNWRNRWFFPAVTDADLGEVRPHDLRHTAVTWAIHAGASIHDIQQMCGHARPSITWDIYGHLLDGHLDDVAARMGERIAGLPGKEQSRNA